MLNSLAWTWGLLLCAAMTTAHAGAIKPSAVKWHPGHYAAVDRKQNSNPRYLKGLYDDLDATPALRGVLLRFTWSELEPSKGQYDFSAIEKHLNELAAHRKQLVLMVETKSFGYPSDSPIAPEYVLNDAAFEN
ncbi:MAG TPA: beta-galactosidase, partial [Burkholderiaceae bacterium]|nr:beta-galactosidase [Burkholderiaceae bacterium]